MKGFFRVQYWPSQSMRPLLNSIPSICHSWNNEITRAYNTSPNKLLICIRDFSTLGRCHNTDIQPISTRFRFNSVFVKWIDVIPRNQVENEHDLFRSRNEWISWLNVPFYSANDLDSALCDTTDSSLPLYWLKSTRFFRSAFVWALRCTGSPCLCVLSSSVEWQNCSACFASHLAVVLIFHFANETGCIACHWPLYKLEPYDWTCCIEFRWCASGILAPKIKNVIHHDILFHTSERINNTQQAKENKIVC